MPKLERITTIQHYREIDGRRNKGCYCTLKGPFQLKSPEQGYTIVDSFKRGIHTFEGPSGRLVWKESQVVALDVVRLDEHQNRNNPVASPYSAQKVNAICKAWTPHVDNRTNKWCRAHSGMQAETYRSRDDVDGQPFLPHVHVGADMNKVHGLASEIPIV
jgi:hypothetical protein